MCTADAGRADAARCFRHRRRRAHRALADHPRRSDTVWRKTSQSAPWEALQNTSSSVLTTSIPAHATWRLAITATDANGNVTPMSAPDIATAVTFNAEPLTIVRATHFAELRLAIQSARIHAGLGAFAYSNAVAAGQPIRAADVAEMRTALGQARSVMGYRRS